ncbi:MAG TPA: SDR family NAD(P)-dependent oxidoreductase [Burkholderiales bacterium]|nr:SDR family NAD(P)-dependent oxidoreductase [Burkholderiales bacterium]
MSTILITGAARGLGLELATQYAKDGWEVIGTVRDDAGRKRLEKIGAEAQVIDVTDFENIGKLASRLEGRALDIVFCNAGIIGRRGMALGSFDYESWDEVMRVNVLGAAAVAEALVDNVAASGKKTLAMMSSRLGSITESSGATLPYATSKAALNMLVKGLAASLAARDVKVVALSPGWVRTDMGGAGAALAPEKSVAGLRKVLADLKAGDSGKFFSYDGSPIPW